jgi:hypothetical protein
MKLTDTQIVRDMIKTFEKQHGRKMDDVVVVKESVYNHLIETIRSYYNAYGNNEEIVQTPIN